MRIKLAWSGLSRIVPFGAILPTRPAAAVCCALGVSFASASIPLYAQQVQPPEASTSVQSSDAFPLEGLSDRSVSPASLQDLIDQLHHAQPDVRANAAGELAWIGKQARPALPALYRALSDDSPLVRLAAAKAVWDVDQQAGTAVPALAELLYSSDSGIRTLAAYELGRIGVPAKRALPTLGEILDGSQGLTQVTIAESMLRIDPENPAAQHAIEAALSDERDVVRCQAAYAAAAVGPGGHERIRTLLQTAAQADNIAVREAARMTLETLPAVEPITGEAVVAAALPQQPAEEPVVAPLPPVPPMVQELIDQLTSEKAVVRKEAAAKLAWLGPDASAAIEPVGQLLNDSDPLVRATAAWAVWEIDGRADLAIPVLAPLIISDRPGLPTLTAYILGKMREDAAPVLPVLNAAMKSADGEFRVILAEAIAKIDPANTQAVTVLSEGLKDPSQAVRVQSAFALASVDERHKPAIVASLQTAAQDADPGVKFAVEQTLTAWNISIPPAQTPEKPAVAAVETEPPFVAANVAPVPLQMVQVPRPEPLRIAQQPPAPAPAPSTVEPPAEESPSDIYASDASLMRTPRQLNIDIRPRSVERRNTLATGLMPEDKDADTNFNPSENPEGYALLQDVIALRQRLNQPAVMQPSGVHRGWCMTSLYWSPTALCHRPLYFEDVNAERYGIHFGLFQPIVSAACFYGTVPKLPYLLAAQCPHECVYTLGYERPGNCVRYRCHCCPCSVKGGLAETAVIWGLIIILY